MRTWSWISAVLLVACSSGDGRPSVSAPSWKLEEELAIDGGTEGFTNVVSVIADQEDNVYVADMGEAHVRVFDPMGKLIRTIGRKGAGPSEFGDLYSLSWLGDTLVTLDPGNARLGFLSQSGAWLTQWPIRPIGGTGVRLSASRDAVYAPGVLIRDNQGIMTAVRHTAAGPGDTLVMPVLRDKEHPGGIACFMSGGGIRVFDVAFASRGITTTSPAGEIVAARSGDYRIMFLGKTGDTLRTVTGAAQPLPVVEREWADRMADYTKWKDENPGVTCDPASISAPSTKPVLVEIWFDDEDRMWVERKDARGHAYDILSPAGELIASIPAVERDTSIQPYVRNERLYVVTTAGSGAQVVRVYSVLGE